MSTEHQHDHEHDNEYGPTPPGAGYEHTDIDTSVGYTFAMWLTVAMVLSLGIVYGAYYMFEQRRVAQDAATQQYPLAAGRDQTPPAPRLQTQPFKDVYLLKQGQNEKLNSYGWTDKDAGMVHIPIERAMDIVRTQQLNTRPDGARMTPVVQDSSAGRTVAAR